MGNYIGPENNVFRIEIPNQKLLTNEESEGSYVAYVRVEDGYRDFQVVLDTHITEHHGLHFDYCNSGIAKFAKITKVRANDDHNSDDSHSDDDS